MHLLFSCFKQKPALAGLSVALWLTCFFANVAHANVISNNTAAAQSPLPSRDESSVSQAADFLPVQEAYQLDVEVQAHQLLLHWTIAEGYFLYGEQFSFELTQNRQPIAMQIHSDKGEVAYDDYFQKDVEKFRHSTTQTLFLDDTTIASDNLLLSARYQGCADAGLCYPPEMVYFTVNRVALTASQVKAPGDGSATQDTPVSFTMMFCFALLGGLILNLMPCVFPVLSIKLLSFARSNESATHLKAHSWFYTLGVLSTFTLTALLLILLRNAGASIGWGFQLQSPVFIAGLALLFFVLGLSLSGFIDIGTRFMGVGQNLSAGNHYGNSFFTGMLAVIVASPCSVPFMGVALGYALTQTTAAALVIFLGLGVGLASPFLVFAYVPWLLQHLPKPGAWMEKLKHWLALPLYLSTLWLLWVLWHQLSAPAISEKDPNQYWQKYSAQTLADHLANNEVVFVELTADWCITCLINEKTALTRAPVLAMMKTKNVYYLRGDWTNGDAEITALLKQYQRGGVPLYLYYDQNKTVTVLPQLLTEQIVLDVLNN